MAEVERIRVEAGAGGEDSEDFARMLREMYTAWDGPVTGEAGVHRLVRISPFDKQRRRHTAFAQVTVHGETSGEQIRSYTLDPSERVKDHRTGQETTQAIEVLAGNLALIRNAPKPLAGSLRSSARYVPTRPTDDDMEAANKWLDSPEGRKMLRHIDHPPIRWRLKAWWTRRWWSGQSRRIRDQQRRLHGERTKPQKYIAVTRLASRLLLGRLICLAIDHRWKPHGPASAYEWCPRCGSSRLIPPSGKDQ